METRGPKALLHPGANPGPSASPDAAPRASADQGGRLLFDLAGIDLSGTHADKQSLESWIPHRGQMSLLDRIVYLSPDGTRGIAHRRIRADEFWCAGHFPSRPIFPGVLQVEAAAQLACYVWVVRKGAPHLAAFLRIEDCSFRSMVVPGDDFYVLCQEIKWQKRRFISRCQGIVGDRVTFEAELSGLAMEE